MHSNAVLVVFLQSDEGKRVACEDLDAGLATAAAGLVKTLPPLDETLRGSLLERYVTCGNRNCKCARGERHGPAWYLSVTLGVGQTSSSVLALDQVDRVRQWIDNHKQVKDSLDRISAINRERLRRERLQEKGNKKTA